MKNISMTIALIVIASPIHAEILRIRHHLGENYSQTDSKQSASMFVDVIRRTPADKIPNFDVTAACRALAGEADAIPDDRQTRGVQHCVDDERAAREQLVTQWSHFKPADRAMCLGGSSAGSVDPVYTELITCLEVTRDAELLNTRTTTPTVRSRNRSG
jgi:hypothetical protein